MYIPTLRGGTLHVHPHIPPTLRGGFLMWCPIAKSNQAMLPLESTAFKKSLRSLVASSLHSDSTANPSVLNVVESTILLSSY